MKTIDACGISCPEPLLMLKNALKSETEIMLLADSKNALANCEDYAKKNGFAVDTISENGVFKIHVSVKK